MFPFFWFWKIKVEATNFVKNDVKKLLTSSCNKIGSKNKSKMEIQYLIKVSFFFLNPNYNLYKNVVAHIICQWNKIWYKVTIALIKTKIT